MSAATFRQRVVGSLRISGLYAALLVPVGLVAVVLSIAGVEGSQHLAPRLARRALLVPANLVPPLAAGLAAYFALGRWLARREQLARGIVAHAIRAWPLYTVALWLGALLLVEVISHDGFTPTSQLILWPLLGAIGAILGDMLAAWLEWPPARHPASVLALSATVLGAGFAAALWTRHYPSTPIFAVMGLAGPRADAGRSCGHMYRRLLWHSLPTRRVVCEGPTYRDGGRFASGPRVTTDALTRRVTHATRTWQAPDSTRWEQSQDSVRIALQRHGGREIDCERPGRQWDLQHMRPAAFWQFPGFSVRMIAYSFIPGMPVGQRPEWLIQLDVYPGGAPECRAAWRMRRAARLSGRVL